MQHRFRKRLQSFVVGALATAVGAVALPAGMASAQVAAPEASPGQSGPIGPEVAPKPANSLRVHGSAAITFTTDYITRGVLLENQGVIAQPTAELDFTLLENPDAKSFGKVIGIVGIWNSVHSHQEFAKHDRLSSWYEFDWYAGIGIDILPELNLNVIYQEFLSPSGAFGVCKNIQAKISYNDSNLWASAAPWNGFSLSPYVIFLAETNGKCGTGSNEGYYVEAGIGPGYTFAPDSKMPVTISLPVTVGLGFDDFYGSGPGFTKDETFGFLSAGVVGSFPLRFMEEAGYGSWKFSIGGYYYLLGDGVKDFNSVAGAGGGGDSEWVASTGLSLSF